MTLLGSSILTRVSDMEPEEVLSKKSDAIAKLEALTLDRLGADTRIVTRDLMPSDLGLTNEEWTDVTGSVDNAYENHIVAGGSTYKISNRRFVVLWGVRNYIPFAGVDAQGISRLRVTVGGGRVAEWSLGCVYMNQSPDTVESLGIKPVAALADDPIFIEQNIEVLIQQYVTTTTATFILSLEGATCEASGVKLHI